MNLEELNKSIKEVEGQLQNLRNEKYRLKEDKIQLDKKESEKNIGRCFVRNNKGNLSYFKIVNTSEIEYEYRIGSSFDETLFPTIMFKYPYDNSKCPFTEEDLRINKHKIFIPGFLDEGEYEEITNEEYIEKFKEINVKWINYISNLNKI